MSLLKDLEKFLGLLVFLEVPSCPLLSEGTPIEHREAAQAKDIAWDLAPDNGLSGITELLQVRNPKFSQTSHHG